MSNESTPVCGDGGGVAAAMFRLSGFVVLAAGVVGGELELLVETTATSVCCGRCAGVASAHDRREHMVRDVPFGDMPVFVLWYKRIWRCRNVDCPESTWSEESDFVRPRAELSNRACDWVLHEVGERGHTVAGVARKLGVKWDTGMGAVSGLGTPLVDAEARLAGVKALGLDEHAWLRANASRHTQFATTVVELPLDGGPARLLDVRQGRTGAVAEDWLGERSEQWRSEVRYASLDAFQGYRTALSNKLPHAERFLDAFHAVKLGFEAMDEVRRRVQHRETGHRGRSGDPLYATRLLLRRRADRLQPHHEEKIEAGLLAGDPDREVYVAWRAAQDLALALANADRDAGRKAALAVIDTYHDCPVPEVARFAKTLRRWQPELVAYFGPVRVTNGPTEAINLIIEKIRRFAHGFRNFDNYRVRLLLHSGRAATPTPPTRPVRTRARRPRPATSAA